MRALLWLPLALLVGCGSDGSSDLASTAPGNAGAGGSAGSGLAGGGASGAAGSGLAGGGMAGGGMAGGGMAGGGMAGGGMAGGGMAGGGMAGGGMAGGGMAGGAAGGGMAGGAAGGGLAGGGAAGGGAGGSSGAGGTTADCSAQIDHIASFSTIVGSCTGVARFTYTDLSVIGYQVFCAPYGKPDEAGARKTALEATGYGATEPRLDGPKAEAWYAFYQPPSDIGDVAVVNARTGFAVFGGSIISVGAGEISYPKMWRPAADLGAGCKPLTLPEAQGFDLGSGQALPAATIEPVLARFAQTALPEGMAKNSYLFDLMVLLYPRSENGFDPATAEWIVLLNTGWLE